MLESFIWRRFITIHTLKVIKELSFAFLIKMFCLPAGWEKWRENVGICTSRVLEKFIWKSQYHKIALQRWMPLPLFFFHINEKSSSLSSISCSSVHISCSFLFVLYELDTCYHAMLSNFSVVLLLSTWALEWNEVELTYDTNILSQLESWISNEVVSLFHPNLRFTWLEILCWYFNENLA
jgi:hypothetical protein